VSIGSLRRRLPVAAKTALVTAGAMAEYLSWETDLLTRIARDGTCNFMRV